MAAPDPVVAPSLSIGDLSASSGISPHTLRAWERRYGKPAAVRLPSGHRRYAESDVAWLRQVHELIAYGHRPSRLLMLDPPALAALADRARAARAEDPRILEWMEAFRTSGVTELRGRARALIEEVGPLAAVQQTIAGFVERVGREWADGRLSIAQEHAITEVFEDLLRTERLRIEGARPAATRRARMVLATLSGERHGLGLQMAALVLATAGGAPLLLGVDLPAEEIVRAARRSEPCAVGLSVSLAHAGPEHGHQLQELRSGLPERFELLVGGLGARAASRGVRGVRVLGGMDELERWAREGRSRIGVKRPAQP